MEAPPNICTPTHIAQAAKKIQEAAPDVFTLEVLEREQCAEMGMGLYLGVSECSEEPPKFIHLTYKSPGTPSHCATWRTPPPPLAQVTRLAAAEIVVGLHTGVLHKHAFVS